MFKFNPFSVNLDYYIKIKEFTELSDTPATYAEQAGNYVTVNDNENALEFSPVSDLDSRFVNVTGDTMTGELTMPDGGINAHLVDVLNPHSVTFDQILTANPDLINKYHTVEIGDRNNGGSLTFNCSGKTNFAGNFLITQQGETVFHISYPSQIIGTVLCRSATWVPLANCTHNLGSPAPNTAYWANTYTNKLYLNATATLDGTIAGHIKFTGDLVPATDDTEYIGEIGSPYKAIKGLVIKDTTDGKHYKVEVINGTITATALD